MTEQELVRRARAGNRAALGELLDAHAAQAYRVALHILGNKADAEDATQNAFVKAFTQLGRFEERSSFATWLLRIVTRESLNLQRSQRTRLAFWKRQAQPSEGQETVESVVEIRAEHRDLWSAVTRLKTNDRVVLTLSYFLDMTEAEAAETLGIKRGAVKKRKHTALRRLRAVVEREFPGLRDSVLEQLEPEWASE